MEADERNDEQPMSTLPLDNRFVAGHLSAAQRLIEALASGDAATLPALLTDDATYEQLGVSLRRRDDVFHRLLHHAAAGIYREVTWADPEWDGTGARAIGRTPADAACSGVALTLRFAGNRISAVRQQNLPARRVAATSLRLTPKLRQMVDSALASRHPMLLAYVDENGQPVLSFRGSTQVFSDDQLAIWVRNADGQMIRALRRNPKLALMYRDEDSKATFQFQGRARVTAAESERRRIYEGSAPVEQHHDFARLGVAVVIDLDRVEGYEGLGPAGQLGRVLMLRDTGRER
jgi:Pyridoxamine 5'-phosphate oxidase